MPSDFWNYTVSIFQNIQFYLLDSTGVVVGLIKRWKPRKCSTEKDYEDSLYEFLNRKVDSIQVTKQYAKGRIRADIVVGDKVIIEIKNNLDSTSKYQRLVGQLVDYNDWGGSIIIVLCGTTDKNLKKQLVKYLEGQSGLLAEDNFRVIEK